MLSCCSLTLAFILLVLLATCRGCYRLIYLYRGCRRLRFFGGHSNLNRGLVFEDVINLLKRLFALSVAQDSPSGEKCLSILLEFHRNGVELPSLLNMQHEIVHVGKQGLEKFWLLILLDRRKNLCLQLRPVWRLNRAGSRLRGRRARTIARTVLALRRVHHVVISGDRGLLFLLFRCRFGLLSGLKLIEWAVNFLCLAIDSDSNLPCRLAFFERANEHHRLPLVLESELLGLFHGAIRQAIDKGSLLALHFCTSSLLILALCHLVLGEGALIKVSVGEVESALNKLVMQHESIEPRSVCVVLFSFACSLSFELGTLKAILWVVCLYFLLDCFD